MPVSSISGDHCLISTPFSSVNCPMARWNCIRALRYRAIVLISLLRKVIPSEVRVACYIVIIATFVTVVDYAIQAISLDLYKALGAFIQLSGL